MIGKIKRVPLHDVWKHEAHELTKYLEENIDVLSDVLNLSLLNPDREQSAGSFNVDLIARDEDGNRVIIENQLGKSDHDHLGKIITYLTAVDAKTAIWIVAQPRSEHIQAINWLNESPSANFYMVKIEAVKIEDSPPAPLFTLIVGPSEEAKEIGQTKKDIAERYTLRKKFWTSLLNRAKEKTKLFTAISPTTNNWITTGGGKQGLGYYFIIRKHETSMGLIIDRGKDLDKENHFIFEQLQKSKAEIESLFGGPLEWDYVQGRRVCYISKTFQTGGLQEEDKWSSIQDVMIDAMIRFEKAIKPHIAKLEI